ncbi:MAG: carboxymuconolactone decarboxylase family protein [Thermoplasmata archaeon]
MGHMTEKLDEFRSLIATLQKEYPEEVGGFLAFMKKAEGGPALSAKEKEIISVALAVAAQCEWCIAFHVSAAASLGATRHQLMEAGFVAVVMHGGPALTYLKPLADAVNEMLPPEPASRSVG